MEKDKWKVLAVDDEPTNLKIMNENYKNDFQLSFANSGKQALEVAIQLQPDIILLDIMMPEMDGYETCRQLKENNTTKQIPILFVSALGEEENETLGFDAGGIDFITKPFNAVILKSRINAHIELKIARDKLIKQNEILKENERLRDDIDGITRHDLKTPLLGMINFPKFVLNKADLSEKHAQYLKKTISLAYKMLKMINLSLDMYKMEKGTYQFRPVIVDVIPIISEIIDELSILIRDKILNVSIRLDGEMTDANTIFTILGEPLLIYSMLSNLIKNAVEASPPETDISINLINGEFTIISIHNQGTVLDSVKERFFEKYVTAGKESGTGLGTYSAKLITEIHNGEILIESNDSTGTIIKVLLPSRKQ